MIDTRLSWPTIEEDENGSEYFECPFCNGTGIGCKGTCIDVGFGPNYQIEPDWPCNICEKTGLIKEFSKAHFVVVKHTIYEIIQDTFGQENIDTLPEEKFKQFYTELEHSINMLKPIFVKS